MKKTNIKPKNIMAMALSSSLFQCTRKESKKTYSRKVKHRKRYE